jgi:arylsulfatase A-like enzyme
MILCRTKPVELRTIMPSTPSSATDDYRTKGILLIAVLFFSWLLSIKSLIVDWIQPGDEAQGSIQPNILLIVVDDLGYNDTSAINRDGLPTPNIKALAQRGTTFRRHYADSTCTPSRVGILTGRYPERSGFRPVGSEIPAEFTTIAQQLQKNGYATYLTGKWHAGEAREQAWPEHKGFNQWFGFLNQWELSGEITASNKGLRRPTYHNPMLRKNGGELERHKGHLTDILTDHTIDKIEQLKAKGKPWFLYHAFLAPHHPIQPAERYRIRFPDTPEGQYSALVTQLDDAIGRILNKVDMENTLVVLVSDNGGTNKQRDNNFPFFGKKGDPYEGAYRTPLIVSWPNTIPQGEFIDDIVMNVDLYPTILSAAHAQAPADIDGKNLWPLILSGTTIGRQGRGWEVFNANVNTLGFSFISGSGDWRLSSFQGLSPTLFNLSEDVSGEVDVSTEYVDKVAALTSDFWQGHWKSSVISVASRAGAKDGQTLYTGYDAMRTPFRYGFAIGLEIGPLPQALLQAPVNSMTSLAGQEGTWELRLQMNRGLEWQIGDTILRDAHFEPSRCNAIILTGYLQPMAHLATREPRSEVKLYSSGFLRDAESGISSSPTTANRLDTPTFVNFNGRALFSNLMLSSFSDSYSPRVSSQFIDIYTSMYREKSLVLADVDMMSSRLCNSP